MSIYYYIKKFIGLAIKNGAIEPEDEIYLRNQCLHFLGFEAWQEDKPEPDAAAEELDSLQLMDKLLTAARENEAIAVGDEEVYAAALMNFITPLPSQVNHQFWAKYASSPKEATDYFYQLAKQVNQVKSREIARNIAFSYPCTYGELEITINLSKPEKDPRAIAAARLTQQTGVAFYPACQLCFENEGFYGGSNQAARSNHRLIRLALNGERWGFQYSPYAYYNEHSIVLNEKHQPMKVDRRTFANLLAFLDLFPHYMIGSNADLPIVGGSILTHDHYQAGRHEFPMAKAGIREKIQLSDFPEISAAILHWPMSVLRLSSENKEEIIAASTKILQKWQLYSDESLQIVALDADHVQHHTITPIARRRSKSYEMDLVLRDNNSSILYPDGIFHPHKELHHIKKENIGLIEVMGLAILPPRLKTELKEVEKYLLNQSNDMKKIHQDWADELKATESFDEINVTEKLQQALGRVFMQVLQDAGVFKDDEIGQAAFRKFLAFVNVKDDNQKS